VVRGVCDPVTQSGHFRLTATCDWETGYIGPWRYFGSGSQINPFDAYGCTWNATGGSVQYTA